MERNRSPDSATEPFTRWAGLYDAIYDRKGKDYDAESGRLLDLVVRHLQSEEPPNGRRWLDAACGTARHLFSLSKPPLSAKAPRFSLHGLDGNVAMLAVAHRRLPDVPFVLGDLRSPPYPDRGVFDVVSCLFASIGYLPSPEDAARGILELARLLRPGGVFALEPPVTVERLRPPETSTLRFEHGGEEVERTTSATVEGELLHVRFDLRVGDVAWTEIHRILLLPETFYVAAMESAGLRVHRDRDGLNGAGLLIAVAAERE